MPRALSFLVAASALFASTQAWAACSEDVAELEQRLQRLEAQTELEAQAEETAAPQGQSDKTEVKVQEEPAEVEVESEEGGAEPGENWFGSAPSLDGAREQIDNARSLAEDGEEEGCMGHVEQARAILDQIDN